MKYIEDVIYCLFKLCAEIKVTDCADIDDDADYEEDF